MAAPDGIIIDPGADVILLCGSDENITKLHVSSSILRHTSSVFKSMLGPHFKEGNRLQQSSKVEIPLPEDDEHAMEIVCRVFHFQNHQIPRGLQPLTILSIAKIADKYDWCTALQFLARCWLELAMRGIADDFDRQLLLASAFMFQDGFMFERFSRELLAMPSHPVLDITEPGLPEPIYKILKSLSKCHGQAFDAITKFVEAAIKYEFDERDTCVPICRYKDMRITSLAKQLITAGLWPRSDPKCWDLRTQLKSMSEFRFDLLFKGEAPHFRQCSGVSGKDRSVIASEFHEEAKKIQTSLVTFCLNCVREDKFLLYTGCDHEKGT